MDVEVKDVVELRVTVVVNMLNVVVTVWLTDWVMPATVVVTVPPMIVVAGWVIDKMNEVIVEL